MNKIFLIAAFLVMFSANIFGFPNIMKHKHEITSVSGVPAATSKECFKLFRTKIKGVSCLSGYCDVTKYYVWVFDEAEEPSCVISSPTDDIETSNFHMEIEIKNGVFGNYHYFEGAGRLFYAKLNGEYLASWQSWIK